MDHSLQPKKRRFKICCCFGDDSSEGETSLITDKDSSISSNLYSSHYAFRHYAANKIYLIGNNNFRYIVCFKHIIIESHSYSTSNAALSRKSKKVSVHMKYSLFSRADEGAKIIDNDLESVPSGRVCNKLRKIMIGRIKMENVIVTESRAGPLCLKLAKSCNVIAIEASKLTLDILMNNGNIYHVSDRICGVQGNIRSYIPDRKIDLIIFSAIYSSKDDEDIAISQHFPNLLEEISKGFEFCENIIIMCSSNINPEHMCEAFVELNIYPLIEFFIFFDCSGAKHVAIFLGKISQIEIPSILNFFLGKLGLSYKIKIIPKTSARNT